MATKSTKTEKEKYYTINCTNPKIAKALQNIFPMRCQASTTDEAINEAIASICTQSAAIALLLELTNAKETLIKQFIIENETDTIARFEKSVEAIETRIRNKLQKLDNTNIYVDREDIQTLSKTFFKLAQAKMLTKDAVKYYDEKLEKMLRLLDALKYI